jgi:integrase
MANRKENAMTMTAKFNPKQYQGKPRIYRPVPGAPRVLRLYVWNPAALEYEPKGYEARRYETAADGTASRKKKSFETLEEARHWQRGVESPGHEMAPAKLDRGPLFADIVREWKGRKFPTIAASTQETYEKILSLYMGSLFGVPVRELNAPRIDAWLDEMKDPNHKWIHSKKRKRFKNELKLLSTILGYYEEYYDDQGFRFPIKRRHYEDADLNRQVRVSKDLSLEEFILFRETLRKTPHGNVLSVLATVQYFQAQRISETAGLYWEDINLDEAKPSKSRLTVRRIIVWPRVRTTPSYIKMGFKNAEANDGIKEQPVFPEAYGSLMELQPKNKKGLVFQIDGRHIEYRLIQFWYDKSFKMVGLPYRGTHIMRHGGCRNLYNEVPDLAVAQQLLGNTSLKTTTIYAKRHKGALTQVAHAKWVQHFETGRNWSQVEDPKIDSIVKSAS